MKGGIKQISGSVLKSNSAMLKVIKRIGFTGSNLHNDPTTLLVTKQLDAQASL